MVRTYAGAERRVSRKDRLSIESAKASEAYSTTVRSFSGFVFNRLVFYSSLSRTSTSSASTTSSSAPKARLSPSTIRMSVAL